MSKLKGWGCEWYSYLKYHNEKVDKQGKPISPSKCLITNQIIGYNELIVCFQGDYEKYKQPIQKEAKLFSMYPSFIDFLYATNVFGCKQSTDEYKPHDFEKYNQNNFYEVVLTGRQQKMRFDIDIKSSTPNFDYIYQRHEKLVLYPVIYALKRVMKSCYGVELNLCKDVVVFSSHDPAVKISYHIIMDNYCLNNERECKQLYNIVIKNLPQLTCKIGKIAEVLPQYIDHSVYGANQQFRMFLSQKYNSGRIKQFVPYWSYGKKKILYDFEEPVENTKHLIIMIYRASLLSWVKERCRELPALSSFPVLRPVSENPAVELTEQQIQDGIRKIDPTIFQVGEVKEGIINLRRTRPSHCKTCNRIHEVENPFIFLKDGLWHINCRRNDKNISTLL